VMYQQNRPAINRSAALLLAATAQLTVASSKAASDAIASVLV